MINARLVEIRPCSSMKPIMSGILVRWHGLSNILKMPHKKEAVKARKVEVYSALLSQVKNAFDHDQIPY